MIIRYESKNHRALVEGWLKKRGLREDTCEDLPALGYVAYVGHDSVPVASGHIRICEGTLAMIEGLVSNPDASSKDRHEGIEEIVKQLIHASRLRGVKKILAYSVDEGTLKRSRSHGFVHLPHTLIGLNLGE